MPCSWIVISVSSIYILDKFSADVIYFNKFKIVKCIFLQFKSLNAYSFNLNRAKRICNKVRSVAVQLTSF